MIVVFWQGYSFYITRNRRINSPTQTSELLNLNLQTHSLQVCIFNTENLSLGYADLSSFIYLQCNVSDDKISHKQTINTQTNYKH